MQFTQFIFLVVSNFRLQAHDMKILKILVQPFVRLITGFGHIVRKRELTSPELAILRLKISGTHLAFIIMVFHRILDFKNGPAFLCRALFIL
jgi:hypothetical protein